MSSPPQLSEIPKQSGFSVPTLGTTGRDKMSASTPNTSTAGLTDHPSGVNVDNVKQSVVKNASSTYDAVSSHPYTQSAIDTVNNHPVTQSLKETATNGPVAQSVKDQHAKTTSEFRSLADSRQTPATSAATGQPLTHYHSFFYNLLTWEHPRVTGLSYLAIITAIFAARYVPILNIAFKTLAYALGTTALVEGLGQVTLSQSLMSTIRPKRYYTIPREALESSLQDVEQLMNFFVIEIQRLLFAEDAAKTGLAFLAAFMGYWMIKFTPLWGLSLIAISLVYFTPLIYIQNKELIDSQVNQASKIVNAQTQQVRELAATHAGNATESLKGYTSDLSAKAQEAIGSARRSISPAAQKTSATMSNTAANTKASINNAMSGSGTAAPRTSGPASGAGLGGVRESDFPHAPKQEFGSTGATSHAEQAGNSIYGGPSAVPSS